MLNPSKSISLVVDLVLSAVFIRASLNLVIFGVKFDSKLIFEDHMRGIVSRVSEKNCILKLVQLVFVDTFKLCCYYAFVFQNYEY